ncbi:MAG: 3',5'-cyclic-nucleotide phosphodiesterase [Deltaproteobacteria bacterium]|nr:3',5'-cyclic-nucleotide phosphodiesterase [Deltaproteobacteria bacterium]
MRLRVLGCSGRLTPTHRSTGFLLNDDALLDAGTVGSALDVEAQERLRVLFLTHAHVDHVKELPFVLMERANKGLPSLILAAIPDVIDAVRSHLLNNVLWPDFTVIGDPPALVYHEMPIARAVRVSDYEAMAVPVHHTVPCAGFYLHRGGEGFIYTGDTATTDAIWHVAKSRADVRTVMVETTFSDDGEAVARKTGHYCPRTLAADAAKAERPLHLLITHMRPELRDPIASDLAKAGLDAHLVEQDREYDLG